MDQALNFAIVGCGVIAPAHARSISELPGVQLVAVCDVIEERAHRLAQNFPAQVYTDYREMLERDDIHIVDVLTPSGLHAEVGSAAARCGKHVIVEKPIDVSRDEAEALIRACRKAGVKLCSISQHRFDPATVELKKAVEAGRLGELHFGGAYTQWYRAQDYYDSAEWRGTWALDGGALMNQSIHYVDLLQYIMGPVEEVFAYSARRAHTRMEAEDIAVASLRFKNGALGVVEGMTLAYPGFCTRLEVFGAEGGVVIENDQIKEWRLRSAENPSAQQEQHPLIVGSSSADIWYQGHRRQIQDMIEAIREDRQPLVNGAEGLKPLEIVLAIYESAKTGMPVKL